MCFANFCTSLPSGQEHRTTAQGNDEVEVPSRRPQISFDSWLSISSESRILLYTVAVLVLLNIIAHKPPRKISSLQGCTTSLWIPTHSGETRTLSGEARIYEKYLAQCQKLSKGWLSLLLSLLSENREYSSSCPHVRKKS